MLPASANQNGSIRLPKRNTRTSSMTTIVAQRISSGRNSGKLTWSVSFVRWFTSASKLMANVDRAFHRKLITNLRADYRRGRILLRLVLFVNFRPLGQLDDRFVDRRFHVVEQCLGIDAEEDRKCEQRGCNGNFAAGHWRKCFRMRAPVFGAKEHSLNRPQDVAG